MQRKLTGNQYRSTIVCIDSYENKIPTGRIFNPYLDGAECFGSLMQFLLYMEDLLDEMSFPQSFNARRTFTPTERLPVAKSSDTGEQRGEEATFALRILFRQNASWQGSLVWLETGQEESFRSVLELLMLMHSALKTGRNRE
jgi:hypothetical protein